MLCRAFVWHSSLLILAFAVWAFGVISNKSLPKPVLRSFLPMFPSRSFMASGVVLVFEPFQVNFCE